MGGRVVKRLHHVLMRAVQQSLQSQGSISHANRQSSRHGGIYTALAILLYLTLPVMKVSVATGSRIYYWRSPGQSLTQRLGVGRSEYKAYIGIHLLQLPSAGSHAA